jgi:hypothetical protein
MECAAAGWVTLAPVVAPPQARTLRRGRLQVRRAFRRRPRPRLLTLPLSGKGSPGRGVMVLLAELRALLEKVPTLILPLLTENRYRSRGHLDWFHALVLSEGSFLGLGKGSFKFGISVLAHRATYGWRCSPASLVVAFSSASPWSLSLHHSLAPIQLDEVTPGVSMRA